MGCYCVSCTWSCLQPMSRRCKNMCVQDEWSSFCQNWDGFWTWLSGSLHLFFQCPTSCYRGWVMPLILSLGRRKSFLCKGEGVNSLLSKLELQRKGRKHTVRWWGMLYRTPLWRLRIPSKRPGPIHLAIQQGQDKKCSNQGCKRKNSYCS